MSRREGEGRSRATIRGHLPTTIPGVPFLFLSLFLFQLTFLLVSRLLLLFLVAFFLSYLDLFMFLHVLTLARLVLFLHIPLPNIPLLRLFLCSLVRLFVCAFLRSFVVHLFACFCSGVARLQPPTGLFHVPLITTNEDFRRVLEFLNLMTFVRESHRRWLGRTGGWVDG